MNSDTVNTYFGEMHNKRALYYDMLSSTNDIAKSEAGKFPESDVVVLAREQSGGRGRLGRSFASAPGGMYLSASHRPSAGAGECLHFTALAALACADAIRSLTGIEPEIKWPNDLQIEGRKLCGILCEAVHSGSSFFLVTGIGVNVTNPMPEGVNAVSLAEFTENPPEIEALAARVVQNLDEYYALAFSRKAELLSRYRSRCNTLGQEIRSKADGTLIGTAVDIDENAALIIRTASGELITKTSGEV